MAHIEVTFGGCDTGLKTVRREVQKARSGSGHGALSHRRSSRKISCRKGSASPSVQVAFVNRHHPSGEEFDTGTILHGSFERLQSIDSVICLSIALRTAPIPFGIVTANRCIASGLRAFPSPSLDKAIVWRRTKVIIRPVRMAVLSSALRTSPAVARRLPGYLKRWRRSASASLWRSPTPSERHRPMRANS